MFEIFALSLCLSLVLLFPVHLDEHVPLEMFWDSFFLFGVYVSLHLQQHNPSLFPHSLLTVLTKDW